MGQQTPIYPLHVAANAKIVDFGGWDMPIHYGSQLEEHHKIRTDAGMCDVSHMTVVDIEGDDVTAYLSYLLCNDVAKLDEPFKALYTAMLNQSGGILDDLIVYRQADGYRLVVNCATRQKDLVWMRQQSVGFSVEIIERADLAIIAVQGPASVARLKNVIDQAAGEAIDKLKPFTCCVYNDWFMARTGYTGEVGIEVILPNKDAPDLWRSLAQAGVAPIGLGARDTLRLEAGMNLYGSDMDETVSPYESNIGFTVVLDGDRKFIGREALLKQKNAGIPRKLTGLVMKARGVLRAHYPVYASDRLIGEVTSGAFSPTLQHSIALARVERTFEGELSVEIRSKRVPVAEARPPFVRNGKQVYKLLD